jgi:hypothetical protein
VLLFQSRWAKEYLKAVLQIEPFEGRGQEFEVAGDFVVVLRVVEYAFGSEGVGPEGVEGMEVGHAAAELLDGVDFPDGFGEEVVDPVEDVVLAGVLFRGFHPHYQNIANRRHEI